MTIVVEDEERKVTSANPAVRRWDLREKNRRSDSKRKETEELTTIFSSSHSVARPLEGPSPCPWLVDSSSSRVEQ